MASSSFDDAAVSRTVVVVVCVAPDVCVCVCVCVCSRRTEQQSQQQSGDGECHRPVCWQDRTASLYSTHLHCKGEIPFPSFSVPSLLPSFHLSPLEVAPPLTLPLEVGPLIATSRSGGAHKLPQWVRAEPACQTYFGAFEA